MPRNQSEQFPEADDLTFPFPDAPHQDVNPKFHARIFWNWAWTSDSMNSPLGKVAKDHYREVCMDFNRLETSGYRTFPDSTYGDLRNFYRRWWIAYLDRWEAAGHAA